MSRRLDDTDRRDILLRLLRAEDLTDAQLETLAAFPWDVESPLVVLSTEHADDVLARYLRGDLDLERVAWWAESIEVREDIGIESSHDELLTALVFELANPEINGALDENRAVEWRRRLGAENSRSTSG